MESRACAAAAQPWQASACQHPRGQERSWQEEASGNRWAAPAVSSMGASLFFVLMVAFLTSVRVGFLSQNGSEMVALDPIQSNF